MKTVLRKNPRTVPWLATLALAGGWVGLTPAQDAATTGTVAPLPAGIMPGSPLAQVVKLAKADVDEALIQTYVSNSPSTFNLDSDKIIYLKDAGVPNDLVTQMIQHDATVNAQLPTVTAPPTTDTATPPPDPNVVPPQPAVPPDNTQPPDAATAPQPPPIMPDAAPDDGTAPPPEPVTLNNFYDDLSPYGNWVVVEGYGRCWVPGVANYNLAWQPYGDHGRWVYTDSGWYWSSDYAWGWGPFHYGRWFHNDRLGWCWSPDTVWGPSWVVWRYSDAYYGWAPLPPGSYYQDGVGFMYDGSLVGADFDFGLDANCFLFVGVADFYSPHPGRHRIAPGLAAQVYHQTKPLNGLTHNRNGFATLGISPTHITQVTHTPVPVVSLRSTGNGSGRVLPTEAVASTRPAGYTMRPPSGYVRTENGTTYARPPVTGNGYGYPVPEPRREPVAEYPPREQSPQRPLPEAQFRQPNPPAREERPAESPPARNYEPIQPARPAPAAPANSQPQKPH